MKVAFAALDSFAHMCLLKALALLLTENTNRSAGVSGNTCSKRRHRMRGPNVQKGYHAISTTRMCHRISMVSSNGEVSCKQTSVLHAFTNDWPAMFMRA